MKPYRIFTTSAASLILLLCFTPQSEGYPFSPLNKIFSTPLCNNWYAVLQDASIKLFYKHLQYDDTEDFTAFCNRLNHWYHCEKIYTIHEKRSVFAKWMYYIGLSQRSPPFCCSSS